MSYIRGVNIIIDEMTKRLFRLLALVLCVVSFAACSEESDGYNANAAVTPYEPLPGRLVASVKTTSDLGGRDYSWEHKFEYDTLGRIKEINSYMCHHRAVAFDNVTRFYKCYITSKANYYYRGNDFEVKYSVSREYPDYPDWNTRENGTDEGAFNSAGVLVQFANMDFEYSRTSLQKAHLDNEQRYDVVRDVSGNVNGFVIYNSVKDSVLLDRSCDFRYSRFRNKTNFDFSGYLGCWGVEQAMYANREKYYASYQLAAFGMLGATSSYLPLSTLSRDSKGEVVKDEGGNPVYLVGEWSFDEKDFPMLYVDASGRRTEIRYVD